MDLGEDAISDFWKEHRARGTPWAINSERGDFVPLALYGDACRVRQIAHQPLQKSIGFFLSCPLFRPRSARAGRWLLCTIDEGLLWGHSTLNKIFARITWSLNLLHVDRFPCCGPSGEALVDPTHQKRAGQAITGKRFQVVELRGDWLWHKQVFRFSSTWTAGARKPVCFACPAFGSGARQYMNVTETSPLWSEQYGLGEFLRKEMPQEGPSFSTIYSVLFALESMFGMFKLVSISII